VVEPWTRRLEELVLTASVRVRLPARTQVDQTTQSGALFGCHCVHHADGK